MYPLHNQKIKNVGTVLSDCSVKRTMMTKARSELSADLLSRDTLRDDQT